jgi:predicted nucleic acid-binding protein
MNFLVDTNVLVRLADVESPEYPLAHAAMEFLIGSKEPIFIGSQVLVEFWSVATRPEAVNGLGWEVTAAADAISHLRREFTVLPETLEVADRWFELVCRCKVSGKRAHDARLAALMLVHHVPQLLTFNIADFPDSWGIRAVHPRALLER